MARPKLPRVKRKCKHPSCNKYFEVKESELKMYCSKACSNTSPFEIEIRNAKTKETIETKYNGKHYMGDPEVQKKHRESMKSNLGVEYSMQLDKNKAILRARMKGTTICRSNKFIGTATLHDSTPIYFKETKVVDYIRSILPNEVVQTSVKNLISPLEIDIYLPNRKFAIEFNGIYWHTEGQGKDKKYHLNKTKLCAQKGIELFHIYDYHWYNKQEIIQSLIQRKLRTIPTITDKLYIEEIRPGKKNKWLNDNHIEGSCYSNYNIALLDEYRTIKSLMCFRKRKNKNGEYIELNRFSNANNINIEDSFQLLFEYFITKYNPNKIILYIDRSIGDIDNYVQSNFTLSDIIKPDYSYVHSNHFDIFNKDQFMKHKLNKKLRKFNASLTESVNMQINGYYKLWNCGWYVYNWKRS